MKSRTSAVNFLDTNLHALNTDLTATLMFRKDPNSSQYIADLPINTRNIAGNNGMIRITLEPDTKTLKDYELSF